MEIILEAGKIEFFYYDLYPPRVFQVGQVII